MKKPSADFPAIPVVNDGERPRVKGTLMLGAVQALRQSTGVLNVPTALLPYLSARMEILNWYPEEDLQEILDVLAAAHPSKSKDEALIDLGRRSADVHASDLYSNALRPGSPFLVDVLWRAQHNTGTISLEESDDELVFQLVDYKGANATTCQSIRGYLEMACIKAGKKVQPATMTKCISNGDACCEWRLPVAKSKAENGDQND